MMTIFVAGMSYRTAPVEIRERLAMPPGRLRCLGCRLKLGGAIGEMVLVSTCNRVELYGATAAREEALRRVFQQLAGSVLDLSPYLYLKLGTAAVEHLFAVASGLDSMVLGETEITGQVKQSYLAAQAAKLTGRMTNRLFQTALQTAKEIRTRTSIGRGATSVGSVAVELAERIFDGDLRERTILIIGAGKMGEACVRHLAKKGARSVLVANRSYERGLRLAAEVGGRAVKFEDLLTALLEADIVVSSTGAPHVILSAPEVAQLMPARRQRPLFLIDIAVPRDIDEGVQHLENVYLYNVDHLETIVRENVRSRECELGRAQAILRDRAAALLTRWASPAAGEASAPIAASRPWLLGPANAVPG